MPTPPRHEHDALGIVEVPGDAYYGAQTVRAIENFPISGRNADPALIRAFLRIKAAAAVANAEAGALDTGQRDGIVRACTELLALSDAERGRHFPVDIYQAGAGTSQNMNANEVVANLANLAAGKPLGSYAPIHPNDHVNRSQSTNDTFPTAMRLALLELAPGLGRELQALAGAFAARASEWRDFPKSARTHLQDAVPIRVGQEFGAYATALARAARGIESAADALRELGIGGSAAGTGLNVPPGYVPGIVRELSRLSGEHLESATDLCEAMQSQSAIGRYMGQLRATALELTRICNDLRLLASGPHTGLAEIELPSVQPGSSIMPGKVNPSILEMVNQVCFAVCGHDHTVSLAVAAGQLELNVMMPVMACASLDATRILTRAVQVLRVRCVDGLRANRDRMRKYFESTPQIATALTPKLGYEAVAKLVQEAGAADRSVIELVRERGLLPEPELAALLDVRALTGGV